MEHEPRLVGLERDVAHLKEQSVFRKDMADIVSPLQQELLTQGLSIKQLAKDMSLLSESTIKTNDAVTAVIQAHEQNMLRQAQAWGLPNVIQKLGLGIGAFTGMVTLGAFIYAVVKFIAHQP